MLGEDDHEIVDNDPLNPDDLFDNDIVPPVSPDAADANGNIGDTGENNEQQKDTTAPPRKYRQVNRLPNLNDAWLINSSKENIRQVNHYFKDIKFKSGKGRERTNLKMILQRYEYFAQQCYPKLCFKDFVEKVEHVSGKKTIKNVLLEIRQGRNEIVDDEETFPNDIDNDVNLDIQNTDTQPASPEQPQRSPPESPNASIANTQEASSPPKMTDEMREFIRRKREEAIAKRKQKLEESMNTSQIEGSDKENETNNEDENNKDKETNNTEVTNTTVVSEDLGTLPDDTGNTDGDNE